MINWNNYFICDFDKGVLYRKKTQAEEKKDNLLVL